tara:strand:+ start:1929 stop:2297 length:369 start_codon:yes stop_codon:yes gene_type:complete
MATFNNSFTYPQKYFLEGEALRHFGIKALTYKNWKTTLEKIPGRYKVKGTNYYVIEPEEFHKWLIETRIEPATKHNKLHDGRKQNSMKGGKPIRDNVSGDIESKAFVSSLSSGTNKSNGLSI